MFMVGLSDLNTNNYGQITRYKDIIKTGDAQIVLGTNHATRHYPQYDDQALIKHRVTQRRKWLSEAETEQIVSSYQNGVTVYELADKFDCNRETISNALKRNGIQPTTKKITDQAKINEIISQYASGKKLNDIAELHSVGASTIRKILIKSGVAMRGRWDYAENRGCCR
ncbi:MAG: helix-turn-helix domain-containing protein [Clostridiales Family XIII bacterium]|nr:helix-turn-helix domain-containing protein [Clostridiales Family XIII bacterium]